MVGETQTVFFQLFDRLDNNIQICDDETYKEDLENMFTFDFIGSLLEFRHSSGDQILKRAFRLEDRFGIEFTTYKAGNVSVGSFLLDKQLQYQMRYSIDYTAEPSMLTSYIEVE